MATTQDDMIAELQRTVAALRRKCDTAQAERDAAQAQRNSEYGERIEQQSATIDVLKVMSASPGNAQPVLDLIVERARACCDADTVAMTLLDGDLLRLTACSGMTATRIEEFAASYPLPLARAFAGGRAILTRGPVQVPDTQVDPDFAQRSTNAWHRSVLAVPLLRDGTSIGAIGLGRSSPGAFSAAQVELLQTFAEQAVIAIGSAETSRSLQTRTADLQESLDYQTATSDVLKVISRSTFDLQPVFNTLVETAARLCFAEQAVIFQREGDRLRLIANFGFPPEYEEYQALRGTVALDDGSPSVGARAIREGRPVHVHDVSVIPDYPDFAVRLGKQRTSLAVPLFRDGEVIGDILLARQRVEPFTDRQIELLNTFADQAVIAMENARLLNEQREALEQQTAMAEVLQVINASPGDLKLVFDAILEKAMRLCGAAFGELYTFDGENFKPAAHQGIPATFAEFRMRAPLTNAPGSMTRRIREGASVVHIADVKDDVLYRIGEPTRVSLVDIGGARTVLTVALRKDESLLGFIVIYRQEVRPFSDRQVSLLENFAAQAVIAMENARLLGELRTALDITQATLRELKVAQANLIQAEKMASLGQLTAGIAHEIKNPLNFVNNFAVLCVDLLKELKQATAKAIAFLDDDQRDEVEDTVRILTSNLDKITYHGKRADGIVKAMLEHSRGTSGERREVDINQLTEEALNLAYHGARASNDRFDIKLGRDFGDAIAPIELNPQDMTRVLLNLFNNGFYAVSQRLSSGEQPGFEPTLRVTTRAVGDTVEIRVRDNGTGIPAEIRDKVFQPFFTTKPTGQGTGLGLSITYDIVTKAHDGTITVDSEVDEFTEFVVTLPRVMFANEASRV